MSQVYIIVSGVSSRELPVVDEALIGSTNDLRQEVCLIFQRLSCFAIEKDSVHVLVTPGQVYELGNKTGTDLQPFVLVLVLFLKSEEDHRLDILSIVDYRKLVVVIKEWLGTMRFGSFRISSGTQVLFRFEQTDHACELLAGHLFGNSVTWCSVVWFFNLPIRTPF